MALMATASVMLKQEDHDLCHRLACSTSCICMHSKITMEYGPEKADDWLEAARAHNKLLMETFGPSVMEEKWKVFMERDVMDVVTEARKRWEEQGLDDAGRDLLLGTPPRPWATEEMLAGYAVIKAALNGHMAGGGGAL